QVYRVLGGGRQLLIVPGQPPEPAQPGEGPLDHPAAGHHRKARHHPRQCARRGPAAPHPAVTADHHLQVHPGPLWVHYGQAYVLIGDSDSSNLEAYFRGQVNGLCGTASSGVMFLMTGLRTGQVAFTVEVSEAPPELDFSWEEIVDAPF